MLCKSCRYDFYDPDDKKCESDENGQEADYELWVDYCNDSEHKGDYSSSSVYLPEPHRKISPVNAGKNSG